MDHRCWVCNITSALTTIVHYGIILLSTSWYCTHTRLPIIRQYLSASGSSTKTALPRYDGNVWRPRPAMYDVRCCKLTRAAPNA
jgi:hypothetical protein